MEIIIICPYSFLKATAGVSVIPVALLHQLWASLGHCEGGPGWCYDTSLVHATLWAYKASSNPVQPTAMTGGIWDAPVVLIMFELPLLQLTIAIVCKYFFLAVH